MAEPSISSLPTSSALLVMPAFPFPFLCPLWGSTFSASCWPPTFLVILAEAYWKIVVVGKRHLAIVCHTWAGAAAQLFPSNFRSTLFGSSARLSRLFAHYSGFSINDLHSALTVVHAHVAMDDWEGIGGGWWGVIGEERNRGICEYRSSNPISNVHIQLNVPGIVRLCRLFVCAFNEHSCV